MGSENSSKKRNKMRKSKMKRNEMKGNKMKSLALVVALSTKKKKKNTTVFSQFAIFSLCPQSLHVCCSGVANTVGMAWQTPWKVTSSDATAKPDGAINQRFYFGFNHLILLQFKSKKIRYKITKALTINIITELLKNYISLQRKKNLL